MSHPIAILLRHGAYHQPADVPSAFLPHPLTAEGESQARQAAAEVLALAARHGADLEPRIACSRMLRAWQTARILADELTAETGTEFSVHEHEQLAERSVGAAANLTVAAIEEVIRRDPRYPDLQPGWKYDPGFALPLQGAESQIAAGTRAGELVAARLAELAVAQPARNRCALFVGHGGAFRYAAVHLGVLTTQEAVARSMYYCRPVALQRTADGTFTHLDGTWKLRQQKPTQRPPSPAGDHR